MNTTAPQATPEAEAVPETPHPLADVWAPGHAVFRTGAHRILLSAGLSEFLLDAASAGRRPVLASAREAWLSWPAAEALRAAGGIWVVRDRSGALFGARSGRRLLGEDGAPSEDPGLLPDFGLERGPRLGGLFLDAYLQRRAEPRTLIGGSTEHVTTGLGAVAGVDGALSRWGMHEPLGWEWDPERLTAVMRTQMPRSERFLGSSADGAAASVQLARTRSGLLEHLRAVVPAGPLRPGSSKEAAAHPAVAETLVALAERFRPQIAVLSYGRVETADAAAPHGPLGFRPGFREPDAPLAVLLGPRAVRDLRLDLGGLAERHDVLRIGSARVPSALIRFTGPDPLWGQLLRFAAELEHERVAAALGNGGPGRERTEGD